jgi:hypothetical protein
MKTGTACLATVTRIVLPFACVAGLTATACGQWWTSYNPDPIIGVWTVASDGSYNRWTLELEGASDDDIITGINIKVSTTSQFQWYSSSGGPVDAETSVDGYTHFLLNPGSTSSPNYISLGDDVNSTELYGCLAATGKGSYAWNAIQNFEGGFSSAKGPAGILGTGPVDILQVVVPSSASTQQDSVTGVPGIFTIPITSETNPPAPATVDYLNSCAPQPIETPITFLSELIPGDALGNGKVDVNDLTIVLANYGQSTIGGTPGKLGWREGNFDNGPTIDVNDLTIVLANYGKTVGAPGPVGAAPEPPTAALVLAAVLVFAPSFARLARRPYVVAVGALPIGPVQTGGGPGGTDGRR